MVKVAVSTSRRGRDCGPSSAAPRERPLGVEISTAYDDAGVQLA
jgi:hypothetical protein